MNTWKEPYPKDIPLLIKEADSISGEIKRNLNENSTPYLKDLYTEKELANGSSRVIRNFEEFVELGYKTNDYLNQNNRIKKNEFKGFYVFGEEIDGKVVPAYIGISRTIFRRLRQHGWGNKHNQCTLAYLIANEQHYKSDWDKGRREFPDHQLEDARKMVQNFKVVLHSVENDYDLYFLEVAVAGILKTKWNSFRTH
ncbi:MAG: hypothetical protein HRT58_00360 [Crocinitomicaceae bacterium]|nr:hypothetical protein [Flavobacteriales bacterium]NQZ34073.1 hypothetical protein [Crocinitomicaceae bacterium]